MPTKKQPSQKTLLSARDGITPEFVAEVCHRLKSGARVRRTLPGGRLHIEGALPFLLVYRVRDDDAGTGHLVRSEASYLIAPSSEKHAVGTAHLMEEVTKTLADERGALLIIELWARDETIAQYPRPACFRVLTSGLDWHNDKTPTAALHLHEALGAMLLPGFVVGAELRHEKPAPPGHEPLLSPEVASARSTLIIGLEVPPIYRETPEGPLYPAALRQLRRQLSTALESTFAEFMRVQTAEQPKDFRALGRSAPVNAAWDADRDLAEVGRRFNLLLSVTPVNTEEEWETFCTRKYRRTPTFHYRLLPFDPDLLKRQLYKIKIEEVEDPTLQHLLRIKRIELDRQITLLEDRDTPRFLPGSVALYGKVEDSLLQLAERLLNELPVGRVVETTGFHQAPEIMDASAFAALAEAEIAHLRERYPACKAQVEIRPDLPGLLVASGDLLIGQSFTVSVERAPALLAHEVGTHVVTYANGRAQRLQMLASGLPGYDALQEGTALLAEHLVGGFRASRLRYLAGRVVAAHNVEHGADFIETFRQLDKKYGFGKRSAWNITMRVQRSGGFTKDAVYLRGLVQLLKLFKESNLDLDLLWSGKVSLDEIEIVRELFLRGILKPNVLRPAFLDTPEAQARLKKLRRGATVFNLLN